MLRPVALGLAALALFAAGAYGQREQLTLGWLAAQTPRTTLEAREALIGPAMTLHPPADIPPPWPAVIQFHGCAGMRADFMQQWAEAANRRGWLAVVVDSTGPRGIDRDRALASVCAGKELIGQERAGDVLAAYDIVRARPDVDASKIVLAGWSHGAWSVMDLIAMTPPRRLPAGVAREGVKPPDIAGAILVYPYCGLGAWTRLDGWRKPVPALALVAGADTVVDPAACPKVFEQLKEDGADIDLVIYPGADHVFDDPFLAPKDRHMYDAEAHADATRRYETFLAEIAGR